MNDKQSGKLELQLTYLSCLYVQKVCKLSINYTERLDKKNFESTIKVRELKVDELRFCLISN